MYLRLPNLRAGYVELVRTVRDHGEVVAPRGQPTRELRHVTVELEDPTDALPLNVGRSLVPAIGIGEAVQLIAGRADHDLMPRVSANFNRYRELDGTFHGAYGARIGDQMLTVERRLKKDPDTRQAVINLWDWRLDSFEDHFRDFPCTLILGFMIRHDRLAMETVMRSQDVWLGVAYDYFMFTQLQLSLANALDIEVGPYVHHAFSLHLYDRDLEKTHGLATQDANRYSPLLGLGQRGQPFYDVMESARRIMRLDSPFNPTSTEVKYLTELRSRLHASS